MVTKQTKRDRCIGKSCRRTVRLSIGDNLQPILERRADPVCTRHALLYYRQGRGSIWVFPLGETEADSLTEEQIIQAVQDSGDLPLPR